MWGQRDLTPAQPVCRKPANINRILAPGLDSVHISAHLVDRGGHRTFAGASGGGWRTSCASLTLLRGSHSVPKVQESFSVLDQQGSWRAQPDLFLVYLARYLIDADMSLEECRRLLPFFTSIRPARPQMLSAADHCTIPPRRDRPPVVEIYPILTNIVCAKRDIRYLLILPT